LHIKWHLEMNKKAPETTKKKKKPLGHAKTMKLSQSDYQLWQSAIIKKWIMDVKLSEHTKWEKFINKNWIYKKFNIILIQVVVGFQKSAFLHEKLHIHKNKVWKSSYNLLLS
jgi:hypothetical protein